MQNDASAWICLSSFFTDSVLFCFLTNAFTPHFSFPAPSKSTVQVPILGCQPMHPPSDQSRESLHQSPHVCPVRFLHKRSGKCEDMRPLHRWQKGCANLDSGKNASEPNAGLSSRTCQRQETAHPSVHAIDSLKLTKGEGLSWGCVFIIPALGKWGFKSSKSA